MTKRGIHSFRAYYEARSQARAHRDFLSLSKIIERIPNFVFWKDVNSIYQGCNDNFAHFVGLEDSQEIVGKSDYDLPWTKGAADIYLAEDRNVIETKQAILNREVPLKTKEGEHRTILVSKEPLFDEDQKIIGIIGIYSDITERKKQEEALREAKERAEAANIAKTAFLENMRHDLRTPLSGVTGFAELMKMKAKDPEMIECAENLLASAKTLFEYHDEILEMIRVTSGSIPQQSRKFNLKAKLERVIALMQAKAKTKRLALHFIFDEKIPLYLIGDAMRIERIVLELLSNALRFTEKGSVQLEVELESSDKEEVILKLSVKDTGIGIPAEKRDEIFSEFTKLTPSYKGLYKGIGLGLAILKEFVSDLKGEVYVESEPNQGSTFTCVIPFKKSLLQTEEGSDPETVLKNHLPAEDFLLLKEQSSAPSISTEKNLAQPRVLLVEDDPLCGMVAKTMLEGLQCHVDVATTGKEAITFAQEHHYQLIFMDIGLPDMSGFQVTEKLRKHLFLSTPIVALSAHAATDEHKQECIRFGMTAVFSKPLSQITADHILDSFVPNYKGKEQNAVLNVTQDEQGVSLESFMTLPLLDGAVAKKLIGSEATASKILEQFLATLPEEVNNIKAAYEGNNFKSLGALVHKIKGSAAYCGAIRLQTICAELQYAEDIQDAVRLEKLYQILLETTAALLTEKTSLKSSLKNKIHKKEK